jgi:hypothetical protein
MSDWTAEELDRIGAADDVGITALGPDGTLRPFTTIWVVRVGDDLYVRPIGPRRRLVLVGAATAPRVASGPAASPATSFQEPDDADHAAIDQAYQAKHSRYGSSYVDPMVSPNATAATLRLVAR